MSEDTVVALKDTIGQFRSTFEKSDGELLVKEEPAPPLDKREVEQESIPKYVPPADSQSQNQ